MQEFIRNSALVLYKTFQFPWELENNSSIQMEINSNSHAFSIPQFNMICKRNILLQDTRNSSLTHPKFLADGANSFSLSNKTWAKCMPCHEIRGYDYGILFLVTHFHSLKSQMN